MWLSNTLESVLGTAHKDTSFLNITTGRINQQHVPVASVEGKEHFRDWVTLRAGLEVRPKKNP
jgi:hypothetical protein